MTSKIYQIFPVANGYIVQVPFEEMNDTAQGMAKVMSQFMPQQDEIQALINNQDKPNKRDANTFIFQELEHALAFLHKHLSE